MLLMQDHHQLALLRRQLALLANLLVLIETGEVYHRGVSFVEFLFFLLTEFLEVWFLLAKISVFVLFLCQMRELVLKTWVPVVVVASNVNYEGLYLIFLCFFNLNFELKILELLCVFLRQFLQAISYELNDTFVLFGLVSYHGTLLRAVCSEAQVRCK